MKILLEVKGREESNDKGSESYTELLRKVFSHFKV